MKSMLYKAMDTGFDRIDIMYICMFYRALKILDDEGRNYKGEPSELQRLIDMRVKCFNNLAAAQLKVGLCMTYY